MQPQQFKQPIDDQSEKENLSIVSSFFGTQALALYKQIHKKSLSNKQLKDFSLQSLPFKKVSTESNVCAKILPKGTKAFKCHDCMFESNSICCVDCFEVEKHKGHIYQLIQVFGGCCDCGDEEKWQPQGSCCNHNNPNLVEEMVERIDPVEEKTFKSVIKFCFYYYFHLYDQLFRAVQLKKSKETKQPLYNKAKNFGTALLNYLCKFNQSSLISNIMTYRCLKESLTQLEGKCKMNSFPQVSSTEIYRNVFNMILIPQTAEIVVNLYTQLFTLRQFRIQLTVEFFRRHSQNWQFSQSGFNHISCQLLTSHKAIRQLVEQERIPPLTYRPPLHSFQNFQLLAQSYVRYYIDIDYLSKLYHSSSKIYLGYHIQRGGLPSLGGYRRETILNEDSINYYGLEYICLQRVGRILNVINSIDTVQKKLGIFQKAIVSLFKQIQIVYNQQYEKFQEQAKWENLTQTVKFLYLGQQETFAYFIFAYFHSLETVQVSSFEDKIDKLFKVLDSSLMQNENCSVEQTLQRMLRLLTNKVIFSSLVLGHPQTLQRYFTYFSFCYKKKLIIPSLDAYLYRLLVSLLSFRNKITPETLCEDTIFKKPLENFKTILNQQDYEDNDEAIFDHRKSMLRLSYFLHQVVEITQTDTSQIIIAAHLNLLQDEKYKNRVQRFLHQMLKVYGKTTLKDFKATCDSFFDCDQAFQELLLSKQVQIKAGSIGFKSIQSQNQSRMNQQENFLPSKLESEKAVAHENHSSYLSIFYFKSLKAKLPLQDQSKKSVLIHPSTGKDKFSSISFLEKVISKNFLLQLVDLCIGYRNLLLIKQGKIKSKQVAMLEALATEILKINRCLNKDQVMNEEVFQKTFNFFQFLWKDSNAFELFSPSFLRLVKKECSELSHLKRVGSYLLNTSAYKFEDQHNQKLDQKALERKRKFEQKKKKKQQKFKAAHQKTQQTYFSVLQDIRKDIKQEQQLLKDAEQQEIQFKNCIICRESDNKNDSPLMLMCFLQISDLYQTFLKGKTPYKILRQNNQQVKQVQSNTILVFKSCQHFIHQQCSKKVNGDKQFFLCQLCKSVNNCLLPIDLKLDFKTNCLEKESKLQKVAFGKQEPKSDKLNSREGLEEKQPSSMKPEVKDAQTEHKNTHKLVQLCLDQIYAMDILMRQNCKNSFGVPLQDENKTLVEKLIESFVGNIIFSGLGIGASPIEDPIQCRNNFFMKKQLSCYQSILPIIKWKIMSEGQPSGQNQLQKSQALETTKAKYRELLILRQEQFQQQKNLVQSLIIGLERYLKYLLFQYFFNNQTDSIKPLATLSQQLQPIQKSLNNLFQNIVKKQIISCFHSDQTQEILIQKKTEKQLFQFSLLKNKTNDVFTILRGQINLYRPPLRIGKLFQERGKCPNCQKVTNLIVICFVCQWKGCKNCSKNSIRQHTNCNHGGTSMFIQIDNGSIYLVARNKYWIYPSIYQDHLGNQFMEYSTKINLEKYQLNTSKLETYYTDLLNYNVENNIRYQQFTKKRAFNAFI